MVKPFPHLPAPSLLWARNTHREEQSAAVVMPVNQWSGWTSNCTRKNISMILRINLYPSTIVKKNTQPTFQVQQCRSVQPRSNGTHLPQWRSSAVVQPLCWTKHSPSAVAAVTMNESCAGWMSCVNACTTKPNQTANMKLCRWQATAITPVDWAHILWYCDSQLTYTRLSCILWDRVEWVSTTHAMWLVVRSHPKILYSQLGIGDQHLSKKIVQVGNHPHVWLKNHLWDHQRPMGRQVEPSGMVSDLVGRFTHRCP